MIIWSHFIAVAFLLTYYFCCGSIKSRPKGEWVKVKSGSHVRDIPPASTLHHSFPFSLFPLVFPFVHEPSRFSFFRWSLFSFPFSLFPCPFCRLPFPSLMSWTHDSRLDSTLPFELSVAIDPCLRLASDPCLP